MREDVYEPLSRFRDEFKEKFSRLTAAKFEELLQQSRVDQTANARLVNKIRKLERLRAKVEARYALWCALCWISGIAAAVGAGAVCLALFSEDPDFVNIRSELLMYGAIVAAAGLLLLFSVFLPACRKTAKKSEKLAEQIDAGMQEAWQQMAPLNALFDWNITAQLIENTVPAIRFDPFFTEARLQDLKDSFGWNDQFNADKSVIHTHSGVIHDNPFILAELRRQEWATKVYTGSLTISWLETVRDSEGKTRTVRRYQTLTASVTKPIPVYLNDKLLIYGNDAAPKLAFSRNPSDLSGEGKSLWNSFKRSHRLRKLKKFARNLDDDSNFTMMSNEEFELLFHAADRNDEVEFRLLFTPLAQQQMVALLNDRSVGFGDDFHFIKDRKINMILAEHLNTVDFSHDPGQFRGYDLKAMRHYFQQYNESFFKAVYFALAPLLIIPLYQQTRTHQAIWNPGDEKRSASWEHEALANYYGDDRFNHPQCITQSILKTRCTEKDHTGARTVEVTAYGFRGEAQVDFVPVFGGDGRMHSVPVEWVEYLPVEHTSNIIIRDNPEPLESDPDNVLYRRTIASFLPD